MPVNSPDPRPPNALDDCPAVRVATGLPAGVLFVVRGRLFLGAAEASSTICKSCKGFSSVGIDERPVMCDQWVWQSDEVRHPASVCG